MDSLELKGDPMANRTLRYVVGAALLLSICAGAAMIVDTTTLVDASSTVAARYHLRSRTSNFYRRASSTRSTGTSFRIFGRETINDHENLIGDVSFHTPRLMRSADFAPVLSVVTDERECRSLM
jgi:hypothetical protein